MVSDTVREKEGNAMEQSHLELASTRAMLLPEMDEATIERKLKLLLTAMRLYDLPVESARDWKGRRTCEEMIGQIESELQQAHVRYFYSQRVKRYLYERFRLVVDGRVSDQSREIVCWTLIDTRTGEPVVACLSRTAPVQAESERLEQTPEKVLYRVPMRDREMRNNAHILCESWNIANAHLCPGCGKPFPERALQGEEAPYQDRAAFRCFRCRVD